jgi:hypothetical protein
MESGLSDQRCQCPGHYGDICDMSGFQGQQGKTGVPPELPLGLWEAFR